MSNNKSDGSTASYYELPPSATELQHLISHRNMNAQIGEIFRACYRYGMASHSDQLRDAKKVLFYATAEVERLEGRKQPAAKPARAEELQADDGWIEWGGGDCPVDTRIKVDIRLRNKKEAHGIAAGVHYWNACRSGLRDITHYRLAKEQA